jgi:hypothetical protein
VELDLPRTVVYASTHGKHITPLPLSGKAEDVNLRDALEERYFAYALSTIM